MGLEYLMDEGPGRAPAGIGSDAEAALERLKETRIPVIQTKKEAAAAEEAIFWNIAHLDEVMSQFARRRDHLHAAAEANPGEARQAEKLADAAERMHLGLERARRGMKYTLEENRARAGKAEETLARIDKAIERLAEAMQSLKLVELEQQSNARIRALERAANERLAKLGVTMPVSSEDQVDVDFHVREVTRLAYEAEALANLQRDDL